MKEALDSNEQILDALSGSRGRYVQTILITDL